LGACRFQNILADIAGRPHPKPGELALAATGNGADGIDAVEDKLADITVEDKTVDVD